MKEDNWDSLLSRIENGTIEERVLALDAFGARYKTIIEIVANAIASEQLDPMFLADRVMKLSWMTRQSFAPVFAETSKMEVKLLSGLILLQSGSRGSLPWLLEVASTPGQYQYDVTCQLSSLGIPEMRDAVLAQLRAAPMSSNDIRSGDVISGLLGAWKNFGEPLPADLAAKLHGEDAPAGVRVALTSLGL